MLLHCCSSHTAATTLSLSYYWHNAHTAALRFEHESDLCAPHVTELDNSLIEMEQPSGAAAEDDSSRITHRVTTVEWLQVLHLTST